MMIFRFGYLNMKNTKINIQTVTHTLVQVFSCCPIRVQGGRESRCSKAFCYFFIFKRFRCFLKSDSRVAVKRKK